MIVKTEWIVCSSTRDRGCVAQLMVLLLTKHKRISQQAATAVTRSPSQLPQQQHGGELRSELYMGVGIQLECKDWK